MVNLHIDFMLELFYNYLGFYLNPVRAYVFLNNNFNEMYSHSKLHLYEVYNSMVFSLVSELAIITTIRDIFFTL